MKKLFILLFTTLLSSAVKGQILSHLSYTATLSTGIPMSEPARTPFSWQIMGEYPLSQRFRTGIGTGISCYEKVLLPLFVHAGYFITPPHKFTPYLDCNIGYAFAPDKKVNGGYYVNPNIGIQYAFQKNRKLLFAIGYELQKLERLKEYRGNYLDAEFCEKLRHHTLSIKVGMIF